MKPFLSISLLLIACCNAYAQAPYTGKDFSGTYDCTGDDKKEGNYTATATLELIKSESTGNYGAYKFNLNVPGYGDYPGHAAAHDNNMAIYFASVDPKSKDFGTGIVSFSKNTAGKWSYSKYYYQPEFKGGNFGTEACVQR